MTIRHAYYLADLDQTFGDEEYGQGLRDLYMDYASNFYTLDKDGRKMHQSSRFCGTSRYDTPDGIKTFLILKNFFNPKPDSFFITELTQ